MHGTKTRPFKAVVAVCDDWGIGKAGKLLVDNRADMRHFVELTRGQVVIMGRNTLEGLPGGQALKGRRNIVLSRTVTDFPGCDVYPSLEEALAHCTKDEDVYIISGASVYTQALSLADHLCLTEVDDTPKEADTFFPEYKADWREVAREDHDIDERHAQRYAFVDYVRK